MQTHPAPREGKSYAVLTPLGARIPARIGQAHGEGVQCGISQRRMDRIRVGGCALEIGELNLGEYIVTQLPGSMQSAKDGPVIETQLRQPLVQALDLHRLGTARRPL